MAPKPTVADYLLGRLRDWDVEHVFAYAGDGINGILAAWGRAENKPQFIQARHEEMAAFEAVGYAKFTGRVGVCMATSGPGAIHLLNGLYDAKLDHVPVVAIVGQTNRSAMGGSYQQEVDLLSLFKDVASEYVQMVTVPEQLPNVLDRAIRTAIAERAPTALIIPADVQELEYSAPTHEFKMVPSSLGTSWPVVAPDDHAVMSAAEILNSGSKVAILAGQGARGARRELEEVAELLGAGVAKPLLGKDVLSDELPYVTGSIGLLGTRPSYEMMMGCDTLLTVGSSFPYTQFLPKFGQARGVQIDIDGKFIGMRYPNEVNLVGDSAATLRALIPHLKRQEDRSWREGIEAGVAGGGGGAVEARGGGGGRRSGQPDAGLPRAVRAAADERHRRGGLRLVRELVRQAAEVPRRHARLAVRQPGHHGSRRAVWHRRQVRPPGPAGHRVRRRRGDADERPGRADHDQALLGAVGRPAADRRRAAQQRPQPGHLGDAGDGGRAEVHRIPAAPRRVLRGLRPQPRPGRDRGQRPRPGRRGLGPGAGRRPAHGARRADRPGRSADSAARHLRAGQGRRHGAAEGRPEQVGRAQGRPDDQGPRDPARRLTEGWRVDSAALNRGARRLGSGEG